MVRWGLKETDCRLGDFHKTPRWSRSRRSSRCAGRRTLLTAESRRLRGDYCQGSAHYGLRKCFKSPARSSQVFVILHDSRHAVQVFQQLEANDIRLHPQGPACSLQCIKVEKEVVERVGAINSYH